MMKTLDSKINEYLLAKSGVALLNIASDFVFLEEDEKIPTVVELEHKYGFSHGTVQNAISALKNLKAIDIENRGKKGAFLKKKNVTILLKIMGIEHLVGCMPLPYSKRYEGLATGLTSCIEKEFEIKSSLAFVRGANNRAEMLLSNRYDYAITSLLAAKEYIKKYKNLIIVKEFGPQSYTGEHVLIFHDKNEKTIKDGMKIGVDTSSVDQVKLTDKVCEGTNVELISLSYSNVLKNVMLGEIDGAVWNKDEIFDKYLDVSYVDIESNKEDTIAVMLANKERSNVVSLLDKIVNESQIQQIQKQVMDGLLIPTY